MAKISRKQIAEVLLPWTILTPIALVLGFVLEPVLYRIFNGTPAEKAESMVLVTIVVLVAAIVLGRLGERLSRPN